MSVELLAGEELCSKCEGVGEVLPPNKEHFGVRICDRCWGKGKLDWITRAMGPKPIKPYDIINIPRIRNVYPKLIAEQLVSVAPVK